MSLDFLFSCSKDENASIGIFVQFVKNSITMQETVYTFAHTIAIVE